jgi:hypothetical protein
MKYEVKNTKLYIPPFANESILCNVVNYRWMLISIILSLLFVMGCKKDEQPCCDPSNPECPNYDPCYGIKPLSAKFDMAYTNNLLNSPIYWPDSTFVGYYIDFISHLDLPQVEHRWYVGAEKIEGVRAVSRNFKFVPRPATIEITHVIEYDSNTLCIDEDGGYDSVTQSFYLINKRSELKTVGTFRGARLGETDSFNITFYYQSIGSPVIIDPTWQIWSQILTENVVVNFDNSGDTLAESSTGSAWDERMFIAHSNHQLYFDNEGGLYYGTGEVDDDGNIHLRYSKAHRTTKGDTTYIHFYGREI